MNHKWKRNYGKVWNALAGSFISQLQFYDPKIAVWNIEQYARANPALRNLILPFLMHFISIDEKGQPDVYKEGRSQKLNKEDARERNQDKKAIAADNWYLLHNFAGQ